MATPPKKDAPVEVKASPGASSVFSYVDGAIVGIRSQVILTTLSAPAVPTPANSSSHFVNGNGFFIKTENKHYIICPSSLVLIPPTVLSLNNRFPYVSLTTPAPPGTVPDVMTKASRILVDVYNVNGKKKAYTYEASLHGVDGAGDIAILYIDPENKWNCTPGMPSIERCHPYLAWGDSQKYCPGEPVYAVGDILTMRAGGDPTGAQQMVAGVLANNKHLDYSGFAQAEYVVAALPIFSQNRGLPLLDRMGRIIGMQTVPLAGQSDQLVTLDEGERNNGVYGPSQRFICRVIGELFKGVRKRKGVGSRHVEVISDATGNYYRYNKAYLGIAWTNVTGDTFDTVINPETGLKSIAFDSISGAFLTYPRIKQLQGVRVTTISGDVEVKYAIVPGPPSIFIGVVRAGDILRDIDGSPVGELWGQSSPGMMTWDKPPGSKVSITLRQAAGGYNKDITYCATVPGFPLLMDYPWYARSVFAGAVGPYGSEYYPVVGFRPAF